MKLLPDKEAARIFYVVIVLKKRELVYERRDHIRSLLQAMMLAGVTIIGAV